MTSYKAVLLTRHRSRRWMHSDMDDRTQRASSKLSANRLAARVCCLHAMAVHTIVLF